MTNVDIDDIDYEDSDENKMYILLLVNNFYMKV